MSARLTVNFSRLLPEPHLRHELSDGVVPESRKPHIYGAILSSACNVGLGRMAAATRATYSDLQWASSWHLREATVRRAFSVVADFQHRQTLCELWGGTGLSSSDGQRFPVAHRTNVALAQPKYFDVGKGVSIYTALDDRYAQFDAKMIPATAREAAYVLDALVDNETDIALFEHTTDTHGYTDLVFALFELLGYRFSPRLKNIGKWRLYGVRGRKLPFPDDLEVYGSVDPALIVEQWDEMVSAVCDTSRSKGSNPSVWLCSAYSHSTKARGAATSSASHKLGEMASYVTSRSPARRTSTSAAVTAPPVAFTRGENSTC